MKVLKFLDKYFEEIICVVALAAMTVVIFIQIILRLISPIVQLPMAWTEEIGRYFFYEVLAAGNSNDSTALACQCFCHLNTKTGGASGNDCNLSLEVKIVCHVFSPFKSLFSAKEYIILPLEKDFCFHSLFVQEKNVLSYKHLARRQ